MNTLHKKALLWGFIYLLICGGILALLVFSNYLNYVAEHADYSNSDNLVKGYMDEVSFSGYISYFKNIGYHNAHADSYTKNALGTMIPAHVIYDVLFFFGTRNTRDNANVYVGATEKGFLVRTIISFFLFVLFFIPLLFLHIHFINEGLKTLGVVLIVFSVIPLITIAVVSFFPNCYYGANFSCPFCHRYSMPSLCGIRYAEDLGMKYSTTYTTTTDHEKIGEIRGPGVNNTYNVYREVERTHRHTTSEHRFLVEFECPFCGKAFKRNIAAGDSEARRYQNFIGR